MAEEMVNSRQDHSAPGMEMNQRERVTAHLIGMQSELSLLEN